MHREERELSLFSLMERAVHPYLFVPFPHMVLADEQELSRL